MDQAKGNGQAQRRVTPFILSRPHLSVQSQGVRDTLDDPHEAARRLREGTVPAVVGALPFDTANPSALTVPVDLYRQRRVWQGYPKPSPIPACTVSDSLPSPARHVEAVETALKRLRAPDDPLTKVVLARSLLVRAEAPILPTMLVQRLVSDDAGNNGFCVDLSPAGADYRGRTLVGSSPEVLVRRSGRHVTCFPLAGTAKRESSVDQDAAVAARLALSVKDLAEHAIVVEGLKSSLGELCDELDVPEAPSLVQTPALWHLGTPISGTLRDERTSALDLALAIHPTAAVCGSPRAEAAKAIAQIEGDRGFYAGAIGWCDGNGDGEWMVAIRCGEIAADGLSVRVYAGGGIVAQSDPLAELAETSAKFATMLTALGAVEQPVPRTG
ncbi:isochorismate synthase [Amycolatopsis alba DSM 44262]|uniref:isochorismate synthase n=1 Tax=Amycolatopsis alba DSM 44262 TaxID=1125972 RepID=A0A229S2J9_AMYAL|nr:isochorismate synthase [Amycolatopsis alba DSM 44262]